MQLAAAVKNNRFEVKKLSPEEWRRVSETSHLVVFNERRVSDMDRIDFALICHEEGFPSGYLTARELDRDSVYWQYGGAFPGTHSSMKAFEVYKQMIDWSLERYKRITTLVENTNIRYLKMALHAGFKIIGCRFFEGQVLVELLKEGEK